MFLIIIFIQSKIERQKLLGLKNINFKKLNVRSITNLYYFIGQNHTFYLYDYTPGYALKSSVGKFEFKSVFEDFTKSFMTRLG